MLNRQVHEFGFNPVNVTLAVDLVGQASACLVLILRELEEVKRRQAEACPT